MKKAFDCVEMKNRLQADLRNQEQCLGAEGVRKQRRQWLATGEDSLARWWRSISAQTHPENEPHVLREDPTEYRTKNDSKP